MKQILALFLVIVLMFSVSSLWAHGTITTLAAAKVDETTDAEIWYKTFTGGVLLDTNYVEFSGFTYSDFNDSKTTIRLKSGEATADSVRWYVVVQGRSEPTDTWFTITTFTDTNSVTPFINVYDPQTYGNFPYFRLLIKKGHATKAGTQTLYVWVVFDRDIMPEER